MSVLCSDCKIIAVEEDSKTPFKPSFRSLKESAEGGCTCCQFLLQCLEDNAQSKQQATNEYDDEPVSLKWWEDDFAEGGGAYLYVGDWGESFLEEKLSFCTFRGMFTLFTLH